MEGRRPGTGSGRTNPVPGGRLVRPLYAGKLAAARYFFSCELPRVDAQLDLLAVGDTMLLDLDIMGL